MLQMQPDELRIKPPEKPGSRIAWIDSLGYRLIVKHLQRLETGQLTVEYGGRSESFGSRDPGLPSAVIRVHDPAFWSHLLLGGELGAAEAFIHGFWSSPDLTAVIRLMLRNLEVLDRLQGGFPEAIEPLRRLAHWLNRNTRKGSRLNIIAHYDLGNDFFRLFLDDTMTYSSGIFESPDSTLHDASIAKLDRLCRKLDLHPGDRLLEIGSGWGSMALHAAKNYGCHVTTTTISDRQHEWVSGLIVREGLSDRVTLLKQDYRDLTGQFDKLVSIEMIEAVGHEFYPAYFGCLGRLLKPDGMAAIQAIVIRDQVYDRARRRVDYIKKYIFPGSCIPSITTLIDSSTAASDLRLFNLEDITPSYARTLASWRERLLGNTEAVRDLGYDDAFIRMWEYYFSYCEGGFTERYIGDVQMLFVKPLYRTSKGGIRVRVRDVKAQSVRH